MERSNDELSQCEAISLLDTIPGADAIAARALVAEIACNMSQFPTAQHWASWAGLCPGNEEGAGKRLNSRTRKGSPWLRRVLVQAAWAVFGCGPKPCHWGCLWTKVSQLSLSSKRGRSLGPFALMSVSEGGGDSRSGRAFFARL